MTEAEAAWIAGLLEGEGCFDYNRTSKYLRIRVMMTDHDVLSRLQDIAGGSIHNVKQQKSHHKPLKEWTISGRKVKPIVDAILPWMGQRRTKKISSLLEASKTPATEVSNPVV